MFSQSVLMCGHCILPDLSLQKLVARLKQTGKARFVFAKEQNDVLELLEIIK